MLALTLLCPDFCLVWSIVSHCSNKIIFIFLLLNICFQIHHIWLCRRHRNTRCIRISLCPEQQTAWQWYWWPRELVQLRGRMCTSRCHQCVIMSAWSSSFRILSSLSGCWFLLLRQAPGNESRSQETQILHYSGTGKQPTLQNVSNWSLHSLKRYFSAAKYCWNIVEIQRHNCVYWANENPNSVEEKSSIFQE